jgi:hypothetical protein
VRPHLLDGRHHVAGGKGIAPQHVGAQLEGDRKDGGILAQLAAIGYRREKLAQLDLLARLLLNDTIPNIQVSWVKLGFPGALACLQAGANDFSGTLMEESISKSAGADYGESVLPGELRAMIRSIGRVPAERYTTYKLRRIFPEADAEEVLPLERMPSHSDHAPLALGY